MCVCTEIYTYFEVCGVQLFGQHAERLGIFPEVPDVKNGLGIREVVLLKIVVQSRSGAPEIRDPSSCIIISHTHIMCAREM